MKNIFLKYRNWKNRLGPWQRRLLFVGFFLLVYLAAHTYSQRHLISGSAPRFDAVTMQGVTVNSNSWKDKPVLLHFWATWCPVCKLEQGMINELAKDYRVITVAMNSGGQDAIEHYLNENELNFPVIVDPQGELARKFGVRGVPTGFVIDQTGRIRFKEIGLTTNWGWRIRLNLAEHF